jgi:hypothetical protein
MIVMPILAGTCTIHCVEGTPGVCAGIFQVQEPAGIIIVSPFITVCTGPFTTAITSLRLHEAAVNIPGAPTVSEKAIGAVVPPGLNAVIFSVKVPVDVGVPISRPLGENINPAGTPVAVHSIGCVPVAMN